MKLQEIPLELRVLEPQMELLNRELLSLADAKDGFLGELLRYIAAGTGKRVRPALVTLAASIGRPEPQDVRRVSLAVELIHIATLVHDDVIDRAVLRRARPTVAAKFGEENAVLLGDYVYARAFEELARVGETRLVQILAETTSVMCQGEIRQVANRFRFDLPEEDYFSFIEKKTASLFEASCRAGGILGRLDERPVEALGRFGRHIGLAFQITDDLLDLVGEENRTGKTLRTDLTYGKMTLPLIRWRDGKKSGAEREKAMSLLANPNGETPLIIRSVLDSGAAAQARDVARHHIDSALASLQILPPGATREGLAAIGRGLAERQT